MSKTKSNEDKEDYVNVSVPIALSITAYARIHMSTFKTLYKDHLYYMDTDSADLDIELDPSLVGNKLGEMNLEHIFNESVYLAPKVYGGLSLKDEGYGEEFYETVKAKGYKEKLRFDDVKLLLQKDSVFKYTHEKWYKNYKNGEINVKEEVYSLMVTSQHGFIFFFLNPRFYGGKKNAGTLETSRKVVGMERGPDF
jgi:hypothetical protein